MLKGCFHHFLSHVLIKKNLFCNIIDIENLNSFNWKKIVGKHLNHFREVCRLQSCRITHTL